MQSGGSARELPVMILHRTVLGRECPQDDVDRIGRLGDPAIAAAGNLTTSD